MLGPCASYLFSLIFGNKKVEKLLNFEFIHILFILILFLMWWLKIELAYPIFFINTMQEVTLFYNHVIPTLIFLKTTIDILFIVNLIISII